MENKHMKSILRRLSIVEGQIRGLRELIVGGAYCIDVITQTSAVKQALCKVEDLLLEGHLSTCTIHQIKKGNERKAVEEILKVYQLKRR
jgi:DNA-binding FrmR family transcriptional regulator